MAILVLNGTPVLGKDRAGKEIDLFPIDTLDRGKYAKFLHNYLVDNSSQNGYVLNLNAQWGSGKSFFINRWMDSIKEKHPVVYVDAWKQDYSDDPMLTVISSIISALEVDLPDGNQKAIALSNRATRFFKAAAPLLAKGLIKKATGMNIDEIDPKDEDASKDTDLYNLSGEAGAALAKCLVDDHNEKLKTVEYLREDIKSLIKAIDSKKKPSLPAFIFIDELDRCRPSYAVEMLEVIKHFFELEDIVFVVATDTEQLQHAVKAVYGEKFDAQTYLGRFFRRRYSLSEATRFQFVDQLIDQNIEMKGSWTRNTPSIQEREQLSAIIAIVADEFKLPLREVEQLTDKFLAVLSNCKKAMNPYLLLILFVLRDKHYSLFEFWAAQTNKSIDFVDEVKKAGILNHKFPICVSMNNTQILALRSEVYGAVAFETHLSELLAMMNKYSLEWSSVETNQESQSLRRSGSEQSPANQQAKLFMQQQLLDLEAKKKDYIEWVELAVSFDD